MKHHGIMMLARNDGVGRFITHNSQGRTSPRRSLVVSSQKRSCTFLEQSHYLFAVPITSNERPVSL